MAIPAGIAELLRAVTAVSDPLQRVQAAAALARDVGAESLVVFVRDPVIGRSLPAPGFPQTLQGARLWQELVDSSIEHGAAEGDVRGDDGLRPARAIGSRDGTSIVLTGSAMDDEAIVLLQIVLPWFGTLFRVESVAERSVVESKMARQAAADASSLASKLDATRADLQLALGLAEAATHARDEFLATVSHELRTPLTSMIGWIHLLRMEHDQAALTEGLETIERNARAQSRLIEDILDFSRISAGKLRLDVCPMDMVDVIKSSIDVVRPAADAKGLRIDSVIDPEAGHVSGDPDRIQQVVWNLMSNAVKFTPRGGRVQVRLERIKSHSELTVSDSGEGIDPGFLPHVFDRFSQADSSSTRTHAGLGLGLGIVRHLVELHGGTVEARSAGQDRGATFIVRLPFLAALTRPDALEAAMIDAAGALGKRELDLTGITVLVVEDNDDSRKLLATILTRAGAVVQAAASAAIALDIAGKGRPDILISDIEMPGEDGYSLIRKIRLQEPAEHYIPAIALTAYTRSVDRVRALEAGFQTHMSKPVEPTELVAAIRSLLAVQRKHQP